MKKQLAIAIVAILLMAVLIVPPVTASALWDGNSVQYSSQWGYNSLTNKSVTASNQSIVGEYSSRLKYYRGPVPVRTSNWPPIIKDSGISVGGVVIRGNKAYWAEYPSTHLIENIPHVHIISTTCSICDDDASVWVSVDGTETEMKIDRSDLLRDGTITLLP
jgi:hypothetical protein